MNILILGSGGREHAFAWKLSQSLLKSRLFIAPGNAGTAMYGENVAIGINEFEKIAAFCLQENVQFLLPGSEDPLVGGIADFFKNDTNLSHIKVLGPIKQGAQLEGSKDFAKAFMAKHGVPTAAYKSFTKETLNDAYQYLETLQPPYVLKADGLAAGKGVVIPETLDEARKELNAMLSDAKFGAASATVVIEEFLKGIEVSVFVLTDGTNYVILPEAKDYKRVGENDTGLNTGGMGAVSPVSFADEAFMNKVEERIIKPTVAGLKQDGIDYRGFIFIGLMNVGGEPYVIEYNVRMGDPETEAVLPRIKSDLLEFLLAACDGALLGKKLDISEQTATTVVLVSGGYPEDYEKGKTVSGLENDADAFIFHCGTKREGNEIKTNGGRVFAVTGLADTMQESLAMAYKTANGILFDKKYCRTDIGRDIQKLSL